MAIKLFDSLKREIRELRQPDPNNPNDVFSFYNCGLTVYASAHIGNFRTFVINDVIRRLLILEWGAEKVRYVRNVTDVDDKTIKRARDEGRPLGEVTKQWTDKFHADCAALNCLPVVVPDIRRTAKEFQGAPLKELLDLLRSAVHEERLLALLMLVSSYTRGDDALKKKIFSLYLKNTRFINNWDLVDLSAPNIVGTYLLDKSREPLYAFAKSRDVWKRRIAILSTFAFIRQDDFEDALTISAILLKDEHDLIHKAVGWMLREIGKRSFSAEERFLKQHYKKMPRTMLRYAIERFPETKRLKYLKGKIKGKAK